MKQGTLALPRASAKRYLTWGVSNLSSNMSPEMTIRSASLEARSAILSKDSKTDSVMILPCSGLFAVMPSNLLPRCRSAQWTNLKLATHVQSTWLFIKRAMLTPTCGQTKYLSNQTIYGKPRTDRDG